MDELQQVFRSIAESAISKDATKPDSDGLPGSVFATLVDPNPNPTGTPTCTPSDENNRDAVNPSTPNSTWEILLVTQGTYGIKPKSELLLDGMTRFQLSPYTSARIQQAPATGSPLLTQESITQMIGMGSTDPNSIEWKSAYIEGILRSTQLSGETNEKILADKIAKAFGAIAPTDQDKYQILTMLSSRLYRNYNDERNPGYNPNQLPVPAGDISLQDLFTAASKNDALSGGVCNDISEAVALIAERLFPKQDVLTITSSTHHGVAITDGNSSKIISWSELYDQENILSLVPQRSNSNVRVSKMVDGKMKEIAVVDTDLGRVISRAYDDNKPLLMTTANAPDAFVRVSREWRKDEERSRKITLSAGDAAIQDGNVAIFVANYESKTKNTTFKIGPGIGYQTGMTEDAQLQVYLQTSVDRTVLRYVNPKVHFEASTGFQMNLFGKIPTGETSSIGNFGDASLDLVQKLKIGNNPKTESKTQWGVDAQVRNTLGWRDMGKTAGLVSYLSAEGVFKALGTLRFHLNQVYVEGNVQHPISKSITSNSSLQYQGSNIGQRLRVVSGLNIQAPKGVKIYVYVGAATSDLPGFQTKNSLLVGPTGGEVGVKVEGKKGWTVGTQVEGLGSQTPQVGVGGSVPLFRKTTPKKPKPSR